MEEFFSYRTSHMNSWNIGIIKKCCFANTSIPVIIWIFESFKRFNGIFSSIEIIVCSSSISCAFTFEIFFYTIDNIIITLYLYKLYIYVKIFYKKLTIKVLNLYFLLNKISFIIYNKLKLILT